MYSAGVGPLSSVTVKVGAALNPKILDRFMLFSSKTV